MIDLGLLSVVAFSSPKAPAPDPELEAQRKRREEEARKERIELAQKKGQMAQASLRRRRTIMGGYRGFNEEDNETLG